MFTALYGLGLYILFRLILVLSAAKKPNFAPHKPVLISKHIATLHVIAHDASDRYTQVFVSTFLAAACEHFCAAVAIGFDPSCPMQPSELKVQNFGPNATQMLNSFLLLRSPLPSSYLDFPNVYLYQKDKRAYCGTSQSHAVHFSLNTTHFFSF